MCKRVKPKLSLMCYAMMILIAAQTPPADAQPAPSAWPMLGQNAQRTGESLFDGPLTCNLKWVTAGGSHSVVIGQEAIYTTASGLTAVNFDGSLRWRLKLSVGESSLAVDQNEVIYIGAYSGPFYAIDANQPGAYVDSAKNLIGGTRWVYPSVGGIQASAVLDDQGAIYVVIDGALCKLSNGGSLLWKYPLSGGAGDCNPAIGADGTVYAGAKGNKTLYALRPDTGTVKWSYRLKDYPYDPVVGDPLVGGDVYVMTKAWILYAINPATGKVRWNVTLPKANQLCLRRPVVDNVAQTVYCAGYNAFCAYGFNGKLKWKLSNVGAFLNKPAIGADGVVYVSSSSRNTLHAVSPNGNIVWSRYVGTPSVNGHEPAIDFDGTLYVGSSNGLQAIRDGAIPWPVIFYARAIPNPAAADEAINLWAASVMATDPACPVVRVDFYLDLDSDGQLDPEIDEWLGVDDLPPETGSNWSVTLPLGFPEGEYRILAQAMDLEGTLSNVVSTELVVEPAGP